MHTHIGDVSACEFDNGHCQLEDGSMLIWKPKEINTCHFERIKKWEGTVTEELKWVSTNGEFALTFNDPKVIKDCGADFVLSDQGYAIPENQFQKLKVQRSKRDIQAQANFDNSTVQLWPCTRLNESQWKLRASDECSNEIPVTLELNGHSRKAYLDQSSSIISEKYTPVGCDNLPSHFRLQDKLMKVNRTSGKMSEATTQMWTPAHARDNGFGIPKSYQIFHNLALTKIDAMLPLTNIDATYRESRIEAAIKNHLMKTEMGEHIYSNNPQADIVQTGWFGFLTGISLDWMQVWVFCCCLYVTGHGLYYHAIPLTAKYALNPAVVQLIRARLGLIGGVAPQPPAEAPAAPVNNNDIPMQMVVMDQNRGQKVVNLVDVQLHKLSEEVLQAASAWPPRVTDGSSCPKTVACLQTIRRKSKIITVKRVNLENNDERETLLRDLKQLGCEALIYVDDLLLAPNKNDSERFNKNFNLIMERCCEAGLNVDEALQNFKCCF
uniref:Uncharacterized protein n=1 Tax=Panagrolaimus superbus TaxID=310955 RepID=A0A914YFK7_9BILA